MKIRPAVPKLKHALTQTSNRVQFLRVMQITYKNAVHEPTALRLPWKDSEDVSTLDLFRFQHYSNPQPYMTFQIFSPLNFTCICLVVMK
jgi:hypothetical protein